MSMTAFQCSICRQDLPRGGSDTFVWPCIHLNCFDCVVQLYVREPDKALLSCPVCRYEWTRELEDNIRFEANRRRVSLALARPSNHSTRREQEPPLERPGASLHCCNRGDGDHRMRVGEHRCQRTGERFHVFSCGACGRTIETNTQGFRDLMAWPPNCIWCPRHWQGLRVDFQSGLCTFQCLEPVDSFDTLEVAVCWRRRCSILLQFPNAWRPLTGERDDDVEEPSDDSDADLSEHDVITIEDTQLDRIVAELPSPVPAASAISEASSERVSRARPSSATMRRPAAATMRRPAAATMRRPAQRRSPRARVSTPLVAISDAPDLQPLASLLLPLETRRRLERPEGSSDQRLPDLRPAASSQAQPGLAHSQLPGLAHNQHNLTTRYLHVLACIPAGSGAQVPAHQQPPAASTPASSSLQPASSSLQPPAASDHQVPADQQTRSRSRSPSLSPGTDECIALLRSLHDGTYSSPGPIVHAKTELECLRVLGRMSSDASTASHE